MYSIIKQKYHHIIMKIHAVLLALVLIMMSGCGGNGEQVGSKNVDSALDRRNIFDSAFSLAESMNSEEISELGSEDEPKAVPEEPPTIKRNPMDEKDIIARCMIAMLTECGNTINAAYRYDFSKDGYPDWIVNIANSSYHDCWAFIEVGDKPIIRLCVDASAAGGLKLYISESREQLIIGKFYSSAATGMQTYWPISGATLANLEYQTYDYAVGPEYTFYVDGYETSQEEYDAFMDSLQLTELSDAIDPENPLDCYANIESSKIKDIMEQLSQMIGNTQAFLEDINQDGHSDGIVLGKITQGYEMLCEYGGEDPNTIIDGASCGIMLKSEEDGVNLTIYSANDMQQSEMWKTVNAPKGILVTDTYTGAVPNKYYDDSDPVGEKEYEYHIPQINIDAAEINSINAKIRTEFESTINECEEKLYETNQYYTPEIYGIRYLWAVNDDILSLVIMETGVNDSATFYVYNVSVINGTIASNDEVLSTCGYSYNDYIEEIKQILQAEIEPYRSDIPEMNEHIEQTLTQENIDAVRPYIDQQGQLCAVVKIFVNAGGGSVNRLVNLKTHSDADLP